MVMQEAMFYETMTDKKVQCQLCARNCIIPEGKVGICRVRINRGGKLYSKVYGRACSVCSDPIEKKPIFHYMPGTYVLSFGTVSCNLRCQYCQNYTITQVRVKEVPLTDLGAPETVVSEARNLACKGIAWTYNEPTVWFEYAYETSKLAKQHKLYTVFVTNGYINPEPLRKLAPYLDTMNIDVKAFTDENYRKMNKAKLSPVINTCELAKKLEIHIELGYLIVPTHNDSTAELQSFSNWVVEKLGENTPVHFLRFQPNFKLLRYPQTPMKTMLNAYTIGIDAGLNYVYLGNLDKPGYEDTYCPNCGKLVIKRVAFRVTENKLMGNKCGSCGAKLAFIVAS
jgi:pyruvate formate lyase activating enzyme